MGYSVDQEMTMSQQDKEIATEASWQAHYIVWTRIMGILDPCGSDHGYKRIVGIYILFLQFWVNYTNKNGLQAATLVSFANAILILFTLQGFLSPVNPSNPTNMKGVIITNHGREKEISMQQ